MPLSGVLYSSTGSYTLGPDIVWAGSYRSGRAVAIRNRTDCIAKAKPSFEPWACAYTIRNSMLCKVVLHLTRYAI